MRPAFAAVSTRDDEDASHANNQGAMNGHRTTTSLDDETHGKQTTAHRHHPQRFEIEAPPPPSQQGNRPDMMEEEDTREDDTSILDPHAVGGGGWGGDMTSAVLGIIKGMVGPAILYLPHGFAGAGYMTALPIMAMSTVLYLHSSQCLLEAWKVGSGEDATTNNHPAVAGEDRHDDGTISTTTTSTIVEQSSGSLLSAHDDRSTRMKHDNNTKSSANVQSKQRKSMSYPQLALLAFGPCGATVVNLGIALMQSGVCLTYLIFVPHNLHSSLSVLFGWTDVSPTVYLVVMVLIQIPLSWIRDIRSFTTTNAMANGLILYGLVVCLYFALHESFQPPTIMDDDDHPQFNATVHHHHKPLWFETTYGHTRSSLEHTNRDTTDDHNESSSSWTNLWDHVAGLDAFGPHWTLFIGTSVLLFEGSITLLLPLQDAVLSTTTRSRTGSILLPQDESTTTPTITTTPIMNYYDNPRARFPHVYRQVIIGIQIFYVVFGITCWMAFGNDVNTVLTTSLPPTLLATTVQLAYSVAVMFTFPLQNFPALDISCRSIAQALSNHAVFVQHVPRHVQSIVLARNTIASVLVCWLAVVAWTTMDALDKVVSLCGSLIGIPIAFIIPPLIHSNVMPRVSPERIMANHFVALLGLCAMVFSSWTTIWEWRD